MQEGSLAARESHSRQLQGQCSSKALASRVRRHADAAQLDIARKMKPFAGHRNQSTSCITHAGVTAKLRRSFAVRTRLCRLGERQHVGMIGNAQRHEAAFSRVTAE